MKQRVFISNAEYRAMNTLKNIDSDRLIAMFCHLRAAKDGRRRFAPIKTQQNKTVKHYRLLIKETNLSRASLDKYLPILIELGFVKLDSDGGVTLRGYNASIEALRGTVRIAKRLVVAIEDKYAHTALNVAYIRVHTNIQKQKNKIDKKETQKLLIKQSLLEDKFKCSILSKSSREAADALIKKWGSYDKFISSYCEETILSLNAYGRIKTNDKERILETKNRGAYFKKKLAKKQLIISYERAEQVLDTPMIYSDYISSRWDLRQYYGDSVFRDWETGLIYRRLSSGVFLKVMIDKKQNLKNNE